jgi:ribosomal protein S11
MGIKRYFANKDNTITNAYTNNLLTRGTGSNMGASDILEAFVIHGQTSASIDAANAEQSRIIIQFPIDELTTDISNGVVPSSSLEYRLKLYNAPHAGTTPLSYSLKVEMLSQDWTEGRGLDMENYSDLGSSNWINRQIGSAWTNNGGQTHAGAINSSSYFFSLGTEDIDLDLNFAVSQWRSGAKSNYGLLLRNTDAAVSGTEGSFYTKKFFGRDSEYYFKRPVLEVRWDSGRKDNRGNFSVSSSALPDADNVNTLYLYNQSRGKLVNIPRIGTGVGETKNTLAVSIYSEKSNTATPITITDPNSGQLVTSVTGGILTENGIRHVSGTYTASLACTSTETILYDVWYSGSTQFYTGTFSPEQTSPLSLIYDTQYVTTITNLHSSYIKGQKPRLRVFARQKDWSPTIYTVATSEIVPTVINDAYYQLFRSIDNMEIIPFGTGSYNFTRLAYDVSGNYFDLDTSFLEPGYSYGIQFVYFLEGGYREQPEIFKFRVEEED